MKQTATISVKKKEEKTILVNDRGVEWEFPYGDSITAIASLVFFTMYKNFEMHEYDKDDFSIEITMTVK